MIPTSVRNLLLEQLLADSNLELEHHEMMRVWRLSGVERLHLAGGGSLVFKYAARPFTTEHQWLSHAAAVGVSAPRLVAATLRDDHLGMLIDDLGPPARVATVADLLKIAPALHSAPGRPAGGLLATVDLACLTQVGRQALDALRAQGRFAGAAGISRSLAQLERVTRRRVAGANMPPFGLCHGELHHSALHINQTGHVTVLDWAMAHTGPGLLDLASWFGTRTVPDQPAARRLLYGYVAAGGSAVGLAERGGLAAEVWAMGWHRVRAAAWFLTGAANGVHGPETDIAHAAIVNRQLITAAGLLDA
ncbi:hypothetical protein Lfu02_00850 [Longispora fulva]|uniref:Aminoglycoside phosphotransferase domain-containing protein n=1 Tax=Longispora fulva TaxID=619741 RepID=A0A8J7GDJ5_9ACTN|nr:phosphotransferase [Longispora fulva]MBG6136045.1 hypothetical protein [Longispora fulva]GIG55713.1 hypothetical protein Lfu02_00850 [Longispora fulva]